jgi:hypothetical protein
MLSFGLWSVFENLRKMMMDAYRVRAAQNPTLLFTAGLREGERMELQRDKTCILGRDPTADVQLDSPFVSRQHAKITFQGGYWFIEDLFSKNGVYKNATRIQPGEQISLFHRDRVQIGNVSTFEFQDPEATVHESEMRMVSPGLWLDEPNRDVFVRGMRLTPPLSPQQFTLLAALVRKDGDVMTHEAVAGVLWPEAAGGVESAAIDNAISRLRSRLAELDEEHDYIETVRGVGRRFVQREVGE